MVVSHGEIVDNGPYNDLMDKSKILRDLVHSIASEQMARQSSETTGIVDSLCNFKILCRYQWDSNIGHFLFSVCNFIISTKIILYSN